MQRKESDWRSVVLAIGAVGGALLLFSGAGLVVAFGALGGSQPALTGAKRPLLDTVVLASALIVIGAAFVPAAYYSIRALLGRPSAAAKPKLLRVWQAVVLIAVWIAAAVSAGFLLDKPIFKWVTPFLYVLAIGVPVFFFARLASGGLHPGSRERLWGALAAGVGLGIAPSVLAELLLAVVGLVGLGVYISLHPDQLASAQHLANLLQNASTMEEILNVLGPWLNNPFALIAALVFFSALSPMIEETAKSITTWTVFDRLTSPSQGFVIGAMSGAAFGMVESLLVSASPETGWTTTLLVRGASTMMHIMAASLTGWGIASLRTSRSIGRLIGMYGLAMALHGTWNACVVAMTFGGLRSAVQSGGADPVGMALIAAGGGVLLVLCLAIPLVMGGINWRFRTMAQPATTAPAEVWEQPSAEEQSGAAEITESEEKTKPSPPMPVP